MSLEIKGTLIEARRAEERKINYKLKDYTFKVGDVLKFKVYSKGKLSELPIFEVETKVTTEYTNVTIIIPEEKMSLFPTLNKETDYWYEIELNGKKITTGYDKDKEKIFRVYPKGVDSNDTATTV